MWFVRFMMQINPTR